MQNLKQQEEEQKRRRETAVKLRLEAEKKALLDIDRSDKIRRQSLHPTNLTDSDDDDDDFIPRSKRIVIDEKKHRQSIGLFLSDEISDAFMVMRTNQESQPKPLQPTTPDTTAAIISTNNNSNSESEFVTIRNVNNVIQSPTSETVDVRRIS